MPWSISAISLAYLSNMKFVSFTLFLFIVNDELYRTAPVSCVLHRVVFAIDRQNRVVQFVQQRFHRIIGKFTCYDWPDKFNCSLPLSKYQKCSWLTQTPAIQSRFLSHGVILINFTFPWQKPRRRDINHNYIVVNFLIFRLRLSAQGE